MLFSLIHKDRSGLHDVEQTTTAVFFKNEKYLGAELKKAFQKEELPYKTVRGDEHFHLLIAMASRHKCSLEIFINNSRHRSSDIVWMLSELSTGSDVQLLNNCNRKYTYAVKMLINGRGYIALTSSAFSVYICMWIGSVHDYFVMHGKNLNSSMKTLNTQNAPDIADESEDEEMEHSSRKYV